jgi:quercetin 2,3-dioxygenase
MSRGDRAGDLNAVNLRRARERGHANLGWLDAQYTFSFASYDDPAWRGFRSLRALNERWLAPRSGFSEHPHANMEILTLVLEGALEQHDHHGKAILNAGDLQRLTAGHGVSHAEFNASWHERVHYLECWITPERMGLLPSRQQQPLPRNGDRGGLHVIGARGHGNGILQIHQDVETLFGRLGAGERVTRAMAPRRYGWIQVLTGTVNVNGSVLEAGDGAAMGAGEQLALLAVSPASVLFFDLP